MFKWNASALDCFICYRGYDLSRELTVPRTVTLPLRKKKERRGEGEKERRREGEMERWREGKKGEEGKKKRRRDESSFHSLGDAILCTVTFPRIHLFRVNVHSLLARILLFLDPL